MNYKNSKWMQLRERVMRRDKYMCRNCRRFGRMREATVIHHVYPCEFYPEYAHDINNLIALCGKCHNAMHDRDTHKLTRLGNEWVERISPLLKPSGNNSLGTGEGRCFQ